MSSTDRRTFIGGAAALYASASIPWPVFAASASQMSAFQIYDALAVCIHPNWSVYRNFRWQPLILELGVPKTRGLLGRQKSDVQYMKPLFDAGAKHCSTMVASSGGTLDRTAAQANIAAIETLWGVQNVFAVEGPNEFNAASQDAAYLRSFVQWFHDAVRARPALNPVKIVAPSVFKRDLNFYKALGSLDPWVDLGCMHYYTDKKKPTQSNTTMDQAFINAHILTPKPLAITETGYSNHVTPKVKAKYTLRVMLELIRRGAVLAANYELFDSKADPLWGLADANMVRRPAFFALKNLVALLKDVPCTPTPLGAKVSGPADLVSMELGCSNGSHLLLMWRDASSTDTDVSSPVTVALPAPASRIEVYRPTFDASIQQVGSGSSIVVQVPDHVVVMRVTP